MDVLLMLLEENLTVDPRVCESAVGGIFSIRSAQVRQNPVRCFPAYAPTFPAKTDRKGQSFV